MLNKGIVFIVVIVFCACTKEDNGNNNLPTPLSSYNLSAYTNGELLTFNAHANTTQITIASDTLLQVLATWYTNLGSEYELQFYNIRTIKGYVGSYNLSSTEQVGFQDVDLGDVSGGFIFYYCTNSTNTCSFSINAYDSINKTISGTFNFTGVGGPGGSIASSPYSSSTINLTNGVFTKVPLQ